MLNDSDLSARRGSSDDAQTRAAYTCMVQTVGGSAHALTYERASIAIAYHVCRAPGPRPSQCASCYRGAVETEP